MKKQIESTAAGNATTRHLERDQLILYRAELSAVDRLLESGNISESAHRKLYPRIAALHRIPETSIYYETPCYSQASE